MRSGERSQVSDRVEREGRGLVHQAPELQMPPARIDNRIEAGGVLADDVKIGCRRNLGRKAFDPVKERLRERDGGLTGGCQPAEQSDSARSSDSQDNSAVEHFAPR